MKLSNRETASVLAALRFWQNNVEDPERSEELNGYGHFTEHTPLTHDEIDELCEGLNCEEPVKHWEPILQRYVENRRHPGDGLAAALANDLMEFASRVDDDTIADTREICTYIQTHVLARARGSKKAVRHWLTERPKALTLWKELSALPIDDNECLQISFEHFPVGTPRVDIWKWFEDTYDLSVATDLMGCLYVNGG